MYPNIDDDALKSFSISIQAELDRLCKTRFCKKTENEGYIIASPEHVYALKLL